MSVQRMRSNVALSKVKAVASFSWPAAHLQPVRIRRATMYRCTTLFSLRFRSPSFYTGSERCLILHSPATGAIAISMPRWMSAWPSLSATPEKSTASKYRDLMPIAKSPCGDAGDRARYTEILIPTVARSRHIFQAPTYYYKTGVVFMAYLNGHQSHFRMVSGFESARSIVHLAELFILADKAGLLVDPALAVERMRRILAVAGVGV